MEADPEGIKSPLNITNGWGRKHNINLRYVNVNPANYDPVSGKDESLLLCGFNELTKENGFFKKELDVSGDPEKLIMRKGLFYFPNRRYVNLPGLYPKGK